MTPSQSTRTAPSTRTARALRATLLALLAPLAACSENMDPGTPDGALRAFALSLSTGDAPAVVNQLSKESRDALARLADLSVQTRAAVDRFPAEARAWASREALAPWMTPEVRPGAEHALLALVVKAPWDALKARPPEEVLQAFSARKTLNEDAQAGVARLRTRSIAQVSMKREGDVWRVSALDEPLSAAVTAAQRNLETLNANAAEVSRRVTLQLDLPR
jgi:hypothetical protein